MCARFAHLKRCCSLFCKQRLLTRPYGRCILAKHRGVLGNRTQDRENEMRTRHIRLYLVVSLCLALWSGSAVFGQAGSEGTITGNVTDPTGAPIPAATI